MQPPPRKSMKAALVLKAVHNEHLSKLQSKHQQECDLLEDLRNFTKQRSTIEKTYADALLKLSTSFLQKKIPHLTEIKSSDGQDRRNVFALWRTLLDENEKLAKARLAAADVYQHQISESAKSLRLGKVQTGKRCFDHLQRIHEEVQSSVRELDKAKKLYYEEEHFAHDAREKAHDADEKLKRKKGNLFQSISSLQKNSAKFSTKRDSLDVRATGARNDYLLNLAASNAHQERYYTVDLPEFIRTLDSEAYEKVTDYILLLSRTELLTGAANQASYNKILQLAELNTRQYNLDCYLHEYPTLKDIIRYQFEPCENDQIDFITSDHNAAYTLEREAKKWAARVFKEKKLMKDNTKLLRMMLCQQAAHIQKHDITDQNILELEGKIDEVRQLIRKHETNKMKADARLETLRSVGVNVDEWLKTSDPETLVAMDTVQRILSRSPSQASLKTIESAQNVEDGGSEVANDSFYDSDFNDAASDILATQETPEIFRKRQSRDLEVESLTNGGDDDFPVEDPEPISESITYLHAIVLYNYEAQNPDELSIFESEQLEIVSEGDGDGWIKARNEDGIEGYIPQNYVEFDVGQAVPSAIEVAPVSFSSVDCHVPQSEEPAGGLHLDIKTTNNVNQVNKDLYCRALYDYEATCPEELSFLEGQIIQIVRKEVCDVDDGWWEGKVEGDTDGSVGLFPSLVVEMLDNNHTFSPQEMMSPPGSAPPLFTPPPMPSYLLPPAQVIITQPTPMREHPDDKEDNDKETEPPPPPVVAVQPTAGFEMEISSSQKVQYIGQFSSSTDSEANEHAVEETTYSELVSSPDTPKSRSPVHIPPAPPVVKVQDDNANETTVDQAVDVDDLPPPPPELFDDSATATSPNDEGQQSTSLDVDSLSSPSNLTGDESIDTVVEMATNIDAVADFADFADFGKADEDDESSTDVVMTTPTPPKDATDGVVDVDDEMDDLT